MIVVVGLGNMGLALARRLVMRGRKVVGVDPLAPRRDALAILAGAEAVPDLSGIDWAGAERALVVVRTPEQMREAVVEIVSRAAAAGRSGLPVLVITTITPADAHWLGEVEAPAVRLVESPITGSEAAALSGTQTAMLAGDLEDADIAFLKDGLMEAVIVFDERGQPALAKLLNNLLCSYNLASFGAVVRLAAQQGLDPVRLREVVVRGSGSSFAARAVVEIIGGLLAKDVKLLEGYLGEIQAVSPVAVEETLAELRRLLARP